MEKKEKPLNEGPEQYDDMIIDLTRERIDQEINNVSAEELKGSIIIGVVAALFGIILTINGYLKFLLNDSKEWYVFLGSWIPIILLTISFASGILLVFARERLRLIKPRETNNDYSKLNIINLKKTIKKELIENFEFIRDSRRYNWILINVGFSALVVSVTGIFITLMLITKP